MIKLVPITTADEALYNYMEKLLTDSFPKEEYRALSQLRAFTDADNAFVNQVIKDGETPVGLLTIWAFEGFTYVEHFATDPAVRNSGYGKKSLEALCSQTTAPLVLEVEEPTEEMSRRRIGFYQRNGFELWDAAYEQPPYKPGDPYLPMRLMVRGNLDCGKDFERIRDQIYREVYGVRPDSAGQ